MCVIGWVGCVCVCVVINVLMMEVLLSLFSRVRSAPEEGGAASNMSLSEEQHTSHGAKR